VTSPIPATLAALGAAVFLAYAIKRASLGNRSALRAAVCFWRGHRPVREPLGHRCSYCEDTTNDLDEWGLGGYVNWSVTYDRANGGSIERREWE
jgi:hypothetical protein